jgi:hypothetical protein
MPEIAQRRYINLDQSRGVRVEDYSVRAEMAERQAKIARTEEERLTFLEMARLWRGIDERRRHSAPTAFAAPEPSRS